MPHQRPERRVGLVDGVVVVERADQLANPAGPPAAHHRRLAHLVDHRPEDRVFLGRDPRPVGHRRRGVGQADGQLVDPGDLPRTVLRRVEVLQDRQQEDPEQLVDDRRPRPVAEDPVGDDRAVVVDQPGRPLHDPDLARGVVEELRIEHGVEEDRAGPGRVPAPLQLVGGPGAGPAIREHQLPGPRDPVAEPGEVRVVPGRHPERVHPPVAALAVLPLDPVGLQEEGVGVVEEGVFAAGPENPVDDRQPVERRAAALHGPGRPGSPSDRARPSRSAGR